MACIRKCKKGFSEVRKTARFLVQKSQIEQRLCTACILGGSEWNCELAICAFYFLTYYNGVTKGVSVDDPNMGVYQCSYGLPAYGWCDVYPVRQSRNVCQTLS